MNTELVARELTAAAREMTAATEYVSYYKGVFDYQMSFDYRVSDHDLEQTLQNELFHWFEQSYPVKVDLQGKAKETLNGDKTVLSGRVTVEVMVRQPDRNDLKSGINQSLEQLKRLSATGRL